MRIRRMKGPAALIFGFFLTSMLFGSLGGAAAASAEDTASAKAAYKLKCLTCHGGDGGGQTSTGKMLKVPDLRSDAVQKKSDADLAKVIAEGKDNMPSFKDTTSEKDIAGLVAYIRELGANAKKAAPAK